MARSTRTSRSWQYLVALGFCAAMAALAQGTADAAATWSATASVSPAAVTLGESGTLYTFRVTNTGTATVRSVQIVQPATGWTVSSCSGPAGWAASKSSNACKYTTPQDGPNPIAPAQTAAFQLTANILAGTADRIGTWDVSIVPNKVIAASPAFAGALTTAAHSFRVLDAVVANATTTPGAACPAANKNAPSASTRVIVVCGRNATTTTQTPVAVQSSLGGTFVQSPGTFASGPVAPGTTSVVLGNWSGATVTNTAGSAKTVVARIGSAANRTSALTTLTGYAASNNAPVVGAATFSAPENSANGTAVGTAGFTDPDLGQTHAFAITAGNTGGAFAVNAGTGAITVADGSQLDYETTTSYTLTVRVTDNGTPALSGANSVTVNVTNVNEAPVVGAATFSVPESSANGTAVGTASFTDPDAGQTGTFAITAGNTGGAFAINAGTGAITIADGSQLDYETTTSYALTVRVTDNGTPPLAGSNTVTVNVTNVDETPAGPVAVDDTPADLDESAGATVVDVLGNDTGTGLSVTAVDTAGTLGQAVVANGGANVTYSPNGAFDYLGQGESATDTFGYTVTNSGGTDTGSVTVTVTGGQLTPQIRLWVAGDGDLDLGLQDFRDDGEDLGLLPTVGQSVIGGEFDHFFEAVLGNAPASAVSYRWELDPTGVLGSGGDYRIAPVQTRATVPLLTMTVPASSQAHNLWLTVTPNNGSPARTVRVRFLYINTDLTLALEQLARAQPDAGVVPQANPDTIAVGGSTTINQVVDPTGRAYPSGFVGPRGLVTYSVGSTILGTADVNNPFVISGTTLGVGTHTVTASYEIWHTIAYAPFTKDVTVTVTAAAPTAVDDAATVDKLSGATPIDVLANDIHPGGPIAVASVTQPANGTVAITGAGAGLTYTPNPRYCNSPGAGDPTLASGPDTFTYTLDTGSTGTVSMTVNPIRQPPVVVDPIQLVQNVGQPTQTIRQVTDDADPVANKLIGIFLNRFDASGFTDPFSCAADTGTLEFHWVISYPAISPYTDAGITGYRSSVLNMVGNSLLNQVSPPVRFVLSVDSPVSLLSTTVEIWSNVSTSSLTLAVFNQCQGNIPGPCTIAAAGPATEPT